MVYNILVREVMTLKPVTISSEKTIYSAARKMEKQNVGSILITENKKLIGILTERDVIKRVLLSGMNAKKTRVMDVMTKRLKTVGPWEDIQEVVEIFNKKGLRRVPVVADGKLVGLVTSKDLLRVEPRIIDALLERLSVREPGRKPLFSGKNMQAGVCEICSNYSDKLVFSEGMWTCEKCFDSLHQ